ncbi:ATP-binding protein [Pseudobacteriovorax antillogorgiicola]|uniref:histidine kinase n=1 Tax=Pseudobacteriovorax antillogorgiicola TaxID=1513793 RepID=A0A1Y6CU33_9BACT|nr:ATP-binding protein [Pseudobacteriovorax antillogorgiicola]TCS44824.1 signal transduction histidine kinase [Pseudobacteriovorax antillogorgiicola]SMF77201.1 Signal transduction histidine kinase [Pseudobacteriovorax antillogorgiicola]
MFILGFYRPIFSTIGVWFTLLLWLSTPGFSKGLETGGSIDLSQRQDFDSTIPLSGDYHVWPKQILDQPPQSYETVPFTALPSSWRGADHPDSSGLATYLIRLTLPPSKTLGIYLSPNYSAQRLQIFHRGQLIGTIKQGIVGENANLETPQSRPQVLSLNGYQGQTLELLWNVSNFHHSRGGPKRVPVVGTLDLLQQDLSTRYILNTFLVTMLVIMALYHLGLFIQRPEDRTSIFFCLAMFSYSIFQGTNAYLPQFFFPDPHKDLESILNRSRYIALYLQLGFFITFIRYLQPGPLIQKMMLPLWVTSLSFVASALFMGPQIYTRGSIYFNYAQGILISATFLHLLYSILRRAKHSVLSTLGFSIYGLAILHDILVGIRVISGFYLISYAIGVFVLIQSYLLAQRFAQTYRDNERLILELAEKEKARTLFFHNTSHELRTPLNGIIGFLQFLSRGRYGELPEPAVSQINKCIRLAQSLKFQVNTILDLAKSKRGNLSLSNSLVSVEDIVTEVDDLATGLMLKKNNLSFKLEQKIADPELIIDREKFMTIIRNLLGNAFKFSDVQRANHVTMKMESQNQHLVIQVSDTGIGIPEDQLPYIFNEFRQVSGDARRMYEGTGLGLAMVKDLVKLMDGDLTVSSEPGTGTTFRVSIPSQSEVHATAGEENIGLFEDNQMPIPRNTRKNYDDKTKSESSDYHILVIDDNQTNCEVIQEILEQSHYRVNTVTSGEEGIRVARTIHPDMILLDMMMPNMSGEDVIKVLHDDSELKAIPIILITARASDDDRVFGLSLGADDYIAKPIHHEELLFRVKNILHRKELVASLTSWEERERLVQLGEMLRDLSHELKNVLSPHQLDESTVAFGCRQILEKVPMTHASWQLMIDFILSSQQHWTHNDDLSQFSFTSPEDRKDTNLRVMRSYLPQMKANDETRLDIWRALTKLSRKERQEVASAVQIISEFLAMRRQNEHGIALIRDILEYSRLSDQGHTCFLDDVVDSILKILSSKLGRLGVQVKYQGFSTPLRVGKLHMMQVLLNLVNNACDAVEDLAPKDRWIAIEARITEGNVNIKVSNGGPPIPEEIRTKLFQESFSGKGHQGFGLGLGISRRLIHKSHGHLDSPAQSKHPEFLITLPKVG